MRTEFKKYFIENTLNFLKEKLMEIATEHNLDYMELEKLYLTEMIEFLQ